MSRELDKLSINAIRVLSADAIEKAKATKGKPTMIIMKTVKGKGIPEIENQVGWHGKAPSEEECERFIKVLEAE